VNGQKTTINPKGEQIVSCCFNLCSCTDLVSLLEMKESGCYFDNCQCPMTQSLSNALMVLQAFLNALMMQTPLNCF